MDIVKGVVGMYLNDPVAVPDDREGVFFEKGLVEDLVSRVGFVREGGGGLVVVIWGRRGRLLFVNDGLGFFRQARGCTSWAHDLGAIEIIEHQLTMGAISFGPSILPSQIIHSDFL